MLRIGEGYDVHRLAAGRVLRVGCVEISREFGAVGHSDADVLAHAICDAILGSMGAGDIGRHFPPSDRQWAGADSALFLQRAAELLCERGWRLINVDATVVLERPRLVPHISAMAEALASNLGCDAAAISIKAKSAEGLGAVGAGEAIEARAVVLVESERAAN